MKKEKLITVIEAKKYWTVVFAIGFFPIVVAYIFFYPINNGFTTFYWFNFAHIFIFFFVVYFITFWKWYPFVQRKNKAFKNGRVINAKIIRVNRFNSEGKLTEFERNNEWSLIAAYKENGVIKKCESIRYTVNPLEYIPKNFNCYLYEYNGNIYFQDFYKRKYKYGIPYTNKEFPKDFGKYNNIPLELYIKYPIWCIPLLEKEEEVKAYEERIHFKYVRSKTCLMIDTIWLSKRDASMKLFIDVHIQSEQEYDQHDFNIADNIREYIKSLSNDFTIAQESELRENVDRLVRRTILEKDSSIIIKEVDIAIYDYNAPDIEQRKADMTAIEQKIQEDTVEKIDFDNLEIFPLDEEPLSADENEAVKLEKSVVKHKAKKKNNKKDVPKDLIYPIMEIPLLNDAEYEFAFKERLCNSMSRRYIIIPPVTFYYHPENAVFVEVRIKSAGEVSTREFPLYERIRKYIRSNEKNLSAEDDREIKVNIDKIVRAAIKERWGLLVHVEKVITVIRWKTRL